MSDAKETVRSLSQFANRMCLDDAAFAKEVMREHRTLQQNIFSLFLKS